MPVYEYQCTTCDEKMEIRQSLSEDTLTESPGCTESSSGTHQLKKLFSAVGISFKGSGFYKNDSRSNSTNTQTAQPAKKEKSTTPAESSSTNAPSKTTSKKTSASTSDA